MKFQVLIVVIFTIYCQTKAAYSDMIFESTESNAESTALAKCEETICSRIYRPLCVSIDGIQTTLLSHCYLAKFKCAAKLNSSGDSKGPIVRVVHNDSCNENKTKGRQNSKWMKIPKDGKYKEGRY